jgi:hypothetical protein
MINLPNPYNIFRWDVISFIERYNERLTISQINYLDYFNNLLENVIISEYNNEFIEIVGIDKISGTYKKIHIRNGN